MSIHTDEHTQSDHSDPSRIGSRLPSLTVALSCDRPAVPCGARLLLHRTRSVVLGRGDAVRRQRIAGERGAVRVELADRRVSTEHARLELCDDWWVITDLGSKNGLFVNGRPIHETKLRDRDVIVVGHTVLVYRSQDTQSVPSHDFLDHADLAGLPGLLSRFRFRIPPLRRRPEDIGPAVTQLLRSIGATDIRISPAAATLVFQNPWPHNLLELRAALHYATQYGDPGDAITVDNMVPWLMMLPTGPSPEFECIKAEWRARTAATPEPFCQLIDRDGSRPISEPAYRQLVADRRDYDLFVDTVGTTGRGRCLIVRRDAEGHVEETTIARAGAAALVELIERRTPLRPEQLRSIDVASPLRVVERARQSADVRHGRYEWRAFHTLSSPGSKKKCFFFDPVSDIQFAAIRKL